MGKAGVVYTALWVFFSVATHRGLSCSKCRDLLRQRKGKGMEERAPPLNIEHLIQLKCRVTEGLWKEKIRKRGVSTFK